MRRALVVVVLCALCCEGAWPPQLPALQQDVLSGVSDAKVKQVAGLLLNIGETIRRMHYQANWRGSSSAGAELVASVSRPHAPPPAAPSLNATQPALSDQTLLELGQGCHSSALDWTDAEGCGCAQYASLCASSPNHDLLQSFAHHAMSALDVCCACGGGTTNDVCHSALESSVSTLGLSVMADISSCAMSESNPECTITHCKQTGAHPRRAQGFATINCVTDRSPVVALAENYLQCSSCHDYPGWTDREGNTCLQYTMHDLCTPDGDYGVGWTSSAFSKFSFNSYARDGVDAAEACCGCGGGVLHDQAACTSVEKIANSTAFNTTSCLASASMVGDSCDFSCRPGFTKVGRHVCGVSGRVSGGYCVKDPVTFSIGSPRPEWRTLVTAGAVPSVWDNDQNWAKLLVRPFWMGGDHDMTSTVRQGAHFFFYLVSFVTWVAFIHKTLNKEKGVVEAGMASALTSLVYSFFVLFAGKGNTCQDVKRFAWTFVWLAVNLVILGKVREDKEAVTNEIVVYNEKRAKQRNARSQNDQDAEYARLAEVPDPATLKDGQKTAFNLEEETDDDDKENPPLQHAPYGIDPLERRAPFAKGAMLTKFALVLLAVAVAYFFAGCQLHQYPYELAYAQRTYHTSTDGNRRSYLPVASGGLVVATNGAWSDFKCSRTKEEPSPYWIVDLGAEYIVDRVVVSGSCGEESSYKFLPVRVVLFQDKEAPTGAGCGGGFPLLTERTAHTLHCRNSKARYVQVRYAEETTTLKRLCLCDVRVFGWMDDPGTQAPSKALPDTKNLGCSLG